MRLSFVYRKVGRAHLAWALRTASACPASSASGAARLDAQMQKQSPKPNLLCLPCRALQPIGNLYVLIDQATFMATADLRNAEYPASQANARLLLRNHSLCHLPELTEASRFLKTPSANHSVRTLHMPRLIQHSLTINLIRDISEASMPVYLLHQLQKVAPPVPCSWRGSETKTSSPHASGSA